MIATTEEIQMCDPASINISKLKDRVFKEKKVKFDLICPFHGFYEPCPNQIYKDYCSHLHIEDCRLAYHHTMEHIKKGEKPDLQA